MKAVKVIFLTFFILSGFSNEALCQAQDWSKLVALESTRDDVENILGKPHKHFETYGAYETKVGKFSVWYSKGGCYKDFEGQQYDISPQKMTRLLVYLHQALPLESFIFNKEEFKKQASASADARPENRYIYNSPDETIIYETIVRKDSTEFVHSIEIQPSKNKQHLLCKDQSFGQCFD